MGKFQIVNAMRSTRAEAQFHTLAIIVPLLHVLINGANLLHRCSDVTELVLPQGTSIVFALYMFDFEVGIVCMCVCMRVCVRTKRFVHYNYLPPF